MMRWLAVALVLALYCLYMVGAHREGYDNLKGSKYIEYKIDRWGKKNGKWRAHVTAKGGPSKDDCRGWVGQGRWVLTPTPTSKPRNAAQAYAIALAVFKIKFPGAVMKKLVKGEQFTCSRAIVKDATVNRAIADLAAADVDAAYQKERQQQQQNEQQQQNSEYTNWDTPGEYTFSNNGKFMGVHDDGGKGNVTNDYKCTEWGPGKSNSVKWMGSEQYAKWRVEHMGDGNYKIRHAGMAWKVSQRSGSKNRYSSCYRNVLQAPAAPSRPHVDGDANARWRFKIRGDNVFILESGNNPGNYLQLNPGAYMTTNAGQATLFGIKRVQGS